jgi:hypothetical protein
MGYTTYSLHIQLLLPSQRGNIVIKHLFEIEEGLDLLLLKSRPCKMYASAKLIN